MFFNPLALIFFLLFLLFVMFFFVMVQIDIIAFAFTEIGIPPPYVISALLFTLIGSFINIPIRKIPQETMINAKTVSFYGFRHVIPYTKKRETVLAINLGGAVIPVLISCYLLFKTELWAQAGLATLFMTFVLFRLAKPLPGVGIALPAFISPVLAAIVSIIISYSNAPVVAYISGTMATLIGADILNLKKIAKLGAPVASIGGAGTFDGIFLNGILAVVLAALMA